MAMGDPRRTREWRRLRDQVVLEEPTCWLRLTGCTTISTEADHIYPYAERPDLAMVRSNLRGACGHCNRARGARSLLHVFMKEIAAEVSAPPAAPPMAVVTWPASPAIKVCADCNELFSARRGPRCRECAVERNRVLNRNAHRVKAGIPITAPIRRRVA